MRLPHHRHSGCVCDLNTALLLSVRHEVEIKPRIVRELHRALDAVSLTANNDERSHEADHLELLAELIGVPALLRFREIALWLACCQHDHAYVLSGIVSHCHSPLLLSPIECRNAFHQHRNRWRSLPCI